MGATLVRAPDVPRPTLRAQARLLPRLLRDPQPVLDELAATVGPVCGMGAGPMRMAIVGEPGALRDLFALPTDAFRWGHKFNVIGFVVGPGSMIVSDGPDHRRRRGSVQPGFSRRRLNGWTPMIVDRADAAIDALAPRLAAGPATVDLYPVVRGAILAVAVRALFGERLAARAVEIGALFQRPQDYLESSAIAQLPHPFPGTKRARVRADRLALDAIVDDEVARRRAGDRGGASEERDDVLDVLLADESLTDAERRDQVVTLMGAGYDTTAASMSWLLWRAAATPDLWGRLRAEADAVLPLGTAVDEGSFTALDLAGRTMRESLRLHPAGALSPRETTRDVEVAGRRIRKGTLVLWSAHLAGRDATAWTDPLRFDPDRFLDLTPEQQVVADSAWVPFGRGARNCIGFALAQLQLTLLVARLAQRLDVAPTSDVLPRPVGMVVNRPTGGVPMRVSAR